MNKMAIIAGEIATGPGLGSSSVIINKIQQPCGRRRAAPARLRSRRCRTAPQGLSKALLRTEPHRIAQHYTLQHLNLYYFTHCFQSTIVH